ncbi:phosphotransferase [Halopelagius longus]|uniref:Aminoglycoside phosphotransferase family protein n=1 Tax=Halopelagius longus TaxID=1236180 RepID=A0A1H0XRK3_9EURY|nr:phosphotransferase [Halopelagius longus]RDI72039.1 aminoglycoside phosphotransferase family protein [Halopelagius longus]SDQ05473.1 Fructosamine-3-kinase [Halopelagius longus]
MAPEDAVRDALESHDATAAVERELHVVPPHAVYEATFGGRRAVCKVARGPTADPATEAAVLRYVAAETPVPVPRVLASGDDHFVAEWCDDVPADPSLTEARVRAMGRGLAALHRSAAEDFRATGRVRVGPDGLTHSNDEAWSETLCELVSDRASYLDAVGYGDLAREIRAVVRENADRLDAVGETTLLHGNYLPDHVGVAAGGVARVIDFEHALVGPGEWDYLRTVVPVFGVDPTPTAGVSPAAFRDAYESVRPLPEGFERRRPLYHLANAASYLRALHVQRSHLDVRVGGVEPEDPLDVESVARRAYDLCTSVRDALDDRRDG